MVDIQFGTDGWRGVIGDTFTTSNVVRVVEALHRSCRSLCDKDSARIVIGYDKRFLSEEAAQLAAVWLQRAGHNVYLAQSAIPTPAVSFMTKSTGADFGIMVTASHNPHLYNGIKFKGSYGGSFTEDMVEVLSSHLPSAEHNLLANTTADTLGFVAEHISKVELTDIRSLYIENLKRFIQNQDFSGIHVAVDPMFGAGSGILAEVLLDFGAEVTEIRSEHNPLFGGIHPEPMDATTKPLVTAIEVNQADIGLCLDGDADRIGARDEEGHFIDSHRIFSLLLKHLHTNRQLKGQVVKTVSTTDMLDKLCAQYDIKLTTTPVGFKYVCDLMLKEEVMLGGEESGGIGISSYLPERDGSLCGLLLCEMLAASEDNSMSSHVKKLMDEVGWHHFRRYDLRVPAGTSKSLVARMAEAPPSDIAGCSVSEVITIDGLKLRLGKNGFCMFRGSGTEPLIRCYCEASSPELLEQLGQGGQEFLSTFIDSNQS